MDPTGKAQNQSITTSLKDPMNNLDINVLLPIVFLSVNVSVNVLIGRLLPIALVDIRCSLSFRKIDQILLWWVRAHYPCLLQGNFMCESIQFGLDALQHCLS